VISGVIGQNYFDCKGNLEPANCRFSSMTGGGFEREACASRRMFKIIVN